jgi:DNA mismatch endonuclease, patch repair protein
MDRISTEHRSWNMSRIRSCDTKPEQIVRSILHRLGFRFRINSGKRIFGKPDIVLPKYKTVIFVHGCFWHRHARRQFAYTPKSRIDFWTAKFAANQRRDVLVKRTLARKGWKVLIIWECKVNSILELKSKSIKIRAAPNRQGVRRCSRCQSSRPFRRLAIASGSSRKSPSGSDPASIRTRHSTTMRRSTDQKLSARL